MNELFIPLPQSSFRDRDFYPPPEGCSYRMAVVSIRKACRGHARRVMMAGANLRQFCTPSSSWW